MVKIVDGSPSVNALLAAGARRDATDSTTSSEHHVIDEILVAMVRSESILIQHSPGTISLDLLRLVWAHVGFVISALERHGAFDESPVASPLGRQ